MEHGNGTARFEGTAALGAYPSGEGAFAVYCVKEFGFARGGFRASFGVYEVSAPVAPDEVEDWIADECAAYYSDADAASRLEACERYDCAPSELGRAIMAELMRDSGDDPYVAFASLRGGDVVSFAAGRPLVELKSLGQADEFGKLRHLFADPGLVSEVERLWRANHLSDMHAGTPAQEKALRDAGLSGGDYETCLKYLEEVGLADDEWEGTGYRYGSAWLDWGVSAEDSAAIADAAASLSALPGAQEAADSYMEAHPGCFGEGEPR